MSDSEFNDHFTPDEPEVIRYHRLEFEFTGRFDQGQPDLEPLFVESKALVMHPVLGKVVKGVLVDCPEIERDIGCVVVDTEGATVAVRSGVLRQLVIENAPCTLEFVAVPLQNHAGDRWWDWEAYEMCPNGPRILVSDPHCERRMAPANQWAWEIRDQILPKLESEQRRLNVLTSHLNRSLGDPVPTLQNPPVEEVLSVVKDQFFGPIYRQAREMLECGRTENSDIVSSPDSHSVHGDSYGLATARAIVDRYARFATHPAIQSELQSRLQKRVQRLQQLRESLRKARAEESRIAGVIDAADTLLNHLIERGSRPVCMCQSTLATSRHLAIPSVPEDLTLT